MFEHFRKNGLYAKLEKCEFNHTTVNLLDYIILLDRINMDPWNIATLMNWALPRTKKFSQIVAPITPLLHKNSTFL